jgi:hypothetical protein
MDCCLTEGEIGVAPPFEIARVYYLYDVADGQKRGGHAHKRLQQLIIPIVGSFRLVLDDGVEKREVILNRPDRGLYIPGHIWTDVMDFSSGSVCMVLASLPYDEEEYIRDYQQFLQFKGQQPTMEEVNHVPAKIIQ